jgi:hypothetical protein
MRSTTQTLIQTNAFLLQLDLKGLALAVRNISVRSRLMSEAVLDSRSNARERAELAALLIKDFNREHASCGHL